MLKHYNVDCGYMLETLTSTHNLCFVTKEYEEINEYPCKPQFDFIKEGFKLGVYLKKRFMTKLLMKPERVRKSLRKRAHAINRDFLSCKK